MGERRSSAVAKRTRHKRRCEPSVLEQAVDVRPQLWRQHNSCVHAPHRFALTTDLATRFFLFKGFREQGRVWAMGGVLGIASGPDADEPSIQMRVRWPCT